MAMNTEGEIVPQAPAGRIRRRVAIMLVLLVPLVWALGFLRFIDSVPRTVPKDLGSADAIVVLTGGANRLAGGFGLLIDGRAEVLFVSGVNGDVRIEDIHALSAEIGVTVPDDLLACCVQLGYQAKNTYGNARETAQWARSRGARSLVLVTSNYHMARARYELERIRPDLVIHEYPVVADVVKLENWWRWPGTMRLLWGEYHKLILAGLRGMVSEILL